MDANPDKNSLWTIKYPLFKYVKIDDHFYNSILQNYLWFTDPSNFNDPYDCNLILPIKKYAKEDWIKYFQYAKDINKLNEFSANQINNAINEYTTNPKSAQELVNSVTEYYVKNTRICCLSRRDDVMLLWSHYDNSHSGICLKFDFNFDDKFFSFPLQVNYSEHIPDFDFINDYINLNDFGVIANYVQKAYIEGDLSSYEILNKGKIHFLFGTKSLDWSHENEVRLINFDGSMEQNISYKKECLTEVIFGYKTNNNSKKIIIDLFNSTGYKCKFSEMKLRQDDFGLEKFSIN